MDKNKAIAMLDSAVAQMPLNRQQHQALSEALQYLRTLEEPKVDESKKQRYTKTSKRKTKMAYDLADVRTRVKNKLDDTDFSNALLTQFINDEQREIFNTYEFPFNQAIDTSKSLDASEFSFTLPTDLQSLKTMEVTSPENEEYDLTKYYMDFTTFKRIYPQQDNESTGQPSYWTMYGDTVEFAWPADKTYTFRIYYLKAPTTLVNDADVPEIPEAFSEVLVLGAYIRALEFNDDNDISQYQRSIRRDLLQGMLLRYSPRVTGKQAVMRNSRWGI